MDRTTRDPGNTFLLTPLSVFLMLTLGTMAGVRASPIPSPLYGAQSFTQQLTLFEEFGPEKLDPTTPAAPWPTGH
uniref:hypothetical protein n=1 Tax=Pseudomonas sp. EA_5y_Pfl2_R50 TaxID=3088691 RepID=UPI0030D71F62